MMENPLSPTLHPALLPPGTQVGHWSVVDWVGRGVHGAVYRAVRVGQEQFLPVALKLALLPRDPRFSREVELLSRQHHPHIPHLIEHGEWQHPSGTLHPYIVMEWVDGVPLYDWARLYHPTSQQVLRLLAQLALALQALHAQGAQHSRAFTALYSAGPADDLFALGVTACKLVTGAYPAMGEARKEKHGTWRMEPLVLPQALHSARVAPPLRALILRMLSMRPEQRGTAAQLVKEMERAASSLTESSAPSNTSPQEQVAGQSSGPRMFPRALLRSWRPWLAAGAAGLALTTWMRWMTPGEPVERPSIAQEESSEADPRDAGPVGLGDAAASTSTQDIPETLGSKAMAEDAPPEPQPGQTRPDAKGRCPRKRQVALNGGCWAASPYDREECAELRGHLYKGTCYLPFIPPGRSPTSSPTDQR